MKDIIFTKCPAFLFNMNPVLIISIILALLIVWGFVNVLLHKKYIFVINIIGFLVSLTIVIMLGILNRNTINKSYIIFPYEKIKDINKSVVIEMLLNILFFEPIGMTFPFMISLYMNKPIKVTIISGFLLSLLIELLQISLQRGTFETSDLFLNTIGTAIGSMSFSLYYHYIMKRDKNNIA